MNPRRCLAPALLLLTLHTASAQCGDPASLALANQMAYMITTIGNACAIFMMVYLGIKWMVAEDPEGRENARRGIIYIVIGLILLRASAGLVWFLLC